MHLLFQLVFHKQYQSKLSVGFLIKTIQVTTKKTKIFTKVHDQRFFHTVLLNVDFALSEVFLLKPLQVHFLDKKFGGNAPEL